MRRHTIKVFPKTADITLLKFLSPEGKLIGERELHSSEIERFATEVEHKYRIVSINSATLISLGRELYEWLDGPSDRWLSGAMANFGELTLRIDVEGRLRHLPWELLYAGGAYLCFNAQQLFTPSRLVAERRREIEQHNRPLRLLFMACSAEDVQPLLDFEGEERMILQTAQRHQIELFVEESGSLDGLRYQVEAFGPGHFDVFHLTGHADVRGDRPCFLMEDDQGFRQEVSADELAEAFQGNWPRLVFLSGCKTGQAPDQGHLPSLCEALVRAGAPAVLGWALPVGDVSASVAAAELYGHLAVGKPIDEAVARSRLHLLKERSDCWHLLRIYSNETLFDGMVTPPKTPKRVRLQIRDAANEFLDGGSKIEVCRREHFVGRRRPIQRCLRVLQSREGDANYAEGILLHGMGGLGKSSLAARLCERLQGYKRLVFVGALGNVDLDFTGKISDALDNAEAVRLLNELGLTLRQRLRNLFRGPLSAQSVIFVFDDFEQNLDESSEGYIAKPVALDILKSLMTAIRDTNSESRVIVTSRYTFPFPLPLRLYPEGLESLKSGELAQKISYLERLQSGSLVEEESRKRAIELGSGNPRLLEWLNRVLADETADATLIMDAMDREAERFREEVLLLELLAQLPPDCRRLIALASVYALPFDRRAIEAAVDGPLDPHLARSVSLGLIERGIDPAIGQFRYFVSRIMLPLIEPEAMAEERAEAERRAANHLYQTLWKSESVSSIEEALEIFRLAMTAREREIAAEIGDNIATSLVNSNRYREAELLCLRALTLDEDYRLLMALARAQFVLGEASEALRHYEKSLSLCPDSDLSNKSAILHNLAGLVAQQGDVTRAFDLWQQSLAILEQIGDVQGKVAVLNQMASVIAQQGDVTRAQELWQQSLACLEQFGDIKSKAATLHNMAGVIAQQGEVTRAQELWQQSLALREQMGDIQGRAATLHEMGGVISQQGDIPRALDLWQQSLALMEQIGDVKGKADILSNMAVVIAQQGGVTRALELWQQSLTLREQIGDIKGMAVSLHNMAGVIARRGDVTQALELWQQSLVLREQIGDMRGKAATLHEMGGVVVRQGDVTRALELWQQSLDIQEQIGNVYGKAVALHNMAVVIAQQGDVTRALEMCQQSLDIQEQIGNVYGKAATLSCMAGLIGRQGDTEKERNLYLESAKGMAAVQAWPDLVTVLSNLGAGDDNDALVFLAQALWLTLRVEVPVEKSLNITATVLQKIGVGADLAPLLGTAAAFIAQSRGEGHPEQEKLIGYGFGMLWTCAEARKIEQDQLNQWFVSEGLNDPTRFLPALSAALEAMVGEEEWLFDRRLVGLA